jgi:hypothetical protein
MTTLFMAAVATLVFAAPGYPGAPDDAQPYLDQFAKDTIAATGWSPGSFTAIYDPTDQGGLVKLGNADSVLAFMPYAFYVQHGDELHLTPLAEADVAGVGTEERWSLVGAANSNVTPQTAAGYTILSVAGYAPEFVRHSALAAWPLPADVKIETTGQILSAMRRVVAGEKVLVLLDQTQAVALPTLPFAAQLKVLVQSPPLPVAVIAAVGTRLPAPRAKAFQAALLKMKSSSDTDTLGSLRLKRFVLPQLPAHTDKP